MLSLIFEAPCSRSTNVIGTSTIRRPASNARGAYRSGSSTLAFDVVEVDALERRRRERPVAPGHVPDRNTQQDARVHAAPARKDLAGSPASSPRRRRGPSASRAPHPPIHSPRAGGAALPGGASRPHPFRRCGRSPRRDPSACLAVGRAKPFFAGPVQDQNVVVRCRQRIRDVACAIR